MSFSSNIHINNIASYLSLCSSNPENARDKLEELASVLKDMVNEGDYDLSNENLSLITDNLNWISNYIDQQGDDYSQYQFPSHARLVEAYLSVCESVSLIRIASAFNNLNLGKSE